eukprot:tig00020812_g14077.t1
MPTTFELFGAPLQVLENPVNAGPGGRLWEGAVRLARYVEELARARPGCLIGKHVLELGAGTGLCGIAAACLGARAVLTDKDLALENLRANVEANPAAFNVEVAELDWTRSAAAFARARPPFDLVLAADCVYHESLFAPLARTMRALSTPGKTEVLLAYHARDVDCGPFFELLAESFKWRAVAGAAGPSAGPGAGPAPRLAAEGEGEGEPAVSPDDVLVLSMTRVR